MAAMAGTALLGSTLGRQIGGQVIEKGAGAAGAGLGKLIGGKRGARVGKAVGSVVGKVGKRFFGFQAGGVVQTVQTPTGNYLSVTKVRTPPTGMRKGGVVKRRKQRS